MNRSFVGDALPENFSGVAVQTDDLESLLQVCTHCVRVNKITAIHEFVRDPRFPVGDSFTIQGSRQEDLLVPNYWRRVTAAAYRSFPFDVFGFTPFHG